MRFCLAILLLVAMPFVSYADTVSDNVELIYFSRMSDILVDGKDTGNFKKLGTLVEQERQSGKNVALISGGGVIAPSAMSSFDHGAHIIDILNSLEPMTVALSAREFVYKEDELVLRVGEAAFPFVSSNITDPLTYRNLEGVEDHVCNTYGSTKVCIISMLDSSVYTKYLPDRINVDMSMDKIISRAKELKADGADQVVLLADNEIEYLQPLYENGVDIVFISSSKADAVEYVSGKPLVRAGTKKHKAVLVNILKQADGTYAYEAEVQDMSGLADHAETAEKIQFYVDKLSMIMSVEIGELITPISTIKREVRTKENAFGNMLSDAMREYYGTDLAFVNGGGIRGNRLYKPGHKLTRQDVQTELPFRNMGVVVKVSGHQVWSALEHGVSRYEDAKGLFLHVSGLEFTFCPQQPIGRRVTSVKYKGKEVQDGDIFTLSTVNFLTDGGDGFDMLSTAEVVRTKKTRIQLWEILREYIEEKGKVAPKAEGRIKIDCK